MLNLIVLALQTDTTRVAAYQICAEDGVGICDKFPTILGIGNRGHHQLTHTNGKREWSQYDRYLAEQFAYFLERLASIREGESRLLDNTMALFGSATSTTHNARNYPTILAGAPTWACVTADSSNTRRNGRSAISMSRCSSATASPLTRSPRMPASFPKSLPRSWINTNRGQACERIAERC